MSNIVEFKLNFKVDAPTKNNRVYKKYIFEKAMKEYVSGNTSFIVSGLNEDFTVNPKKVIGQVNDYKIEGSNILIKGVVYNQEFKYLIEIGEAIGTISGIGSIKENNEVGEDFKIVSINILPKEEVR